MDVGDVEEMEAVMFYHNNIALDVDFQVFWNTEQVIVGLKLA